MAGVYGTLNSRADYYRVLDEAIATAKHYVAVNPANFVAKAALPQLEAMKSWTANGRAPHDDEKDRITLGLLVVREMNSGDTGDPRADEWADQLTVLGNFFEGWPTDQIASTASRSETDRLGEQRMRRKYFGKKKTP